MQNKFYILRSSNKTELTTSSRNVETAERQTVNNVKGYPLLFDVSSIKEGSGLAPIFIIASDILCQSAQVIMLNSSNTYIGYVSVSGNNYVQLDKDTRHIYVNFVFDNNDSKSPDIWFFVGYEVVPHYKKIEIKSKKPNNQMFFRESLDGQIKLFGDGYNYVNRTNIEQNNALVIIRNNTVISRNVFNKSDCKFDHSRCSVELKVSPEDKYTKILDKYDDTYDLIKLAPAITPLILKKRMAYQFYVAGANNVTTVEASGIYYEDDVNTVVNDETELISRYHFNKLEGRGELHLEGFNYQAINGSYLIDPNSNTWVNINPGAAQGSFIRFELAYPVGTYYENIPYYSMIRRISNGTYLESSEWDEVFDDDRLIVDLYSINLYINKPDGSTGTPVKLYQSPKVDDAGLDGWFFKDRGNFLISNDGGPGYYRMWAISQSPQPEPSQFQLQENIISYYIFCRLISNKKNASYGGTSYTLYDIPSDDFCFNRSNYKYCIGASPEVTIAQNIATSSKPTRYGRDDYGKYFSINDFGSTFVIKPIPISRSSWANTSIWAMLGNNFFDVDSVLTEEFTLNDAYDLASVISAMLKEIDPNIMHSGTAEYSQFLYAINSPIAFDTFRQNCNIYITPKSNVLKSNYDQAAQKAEITFEKLMNMLRDCFRCYWFIDDQNRFRIEHVSYFLNGMSYSSASVQLDLTSKNDKFNKKLALYDQEQTSFSKSELFSRLEFEWMDDCTDVFGNNSVDVDSRYVQQDKVENINAGIFSTDIDLMLCAPDKFSNDGFALLIANRNTRKLPIIEYTFFDGDCNYIARPQNYLASWLYLMRYYMSDMPARNITYTNIIQNYDSAYVPYGVKKCKQHDIQFPENQVVASVNAGLVKTNLGRGYIEEKSVNIDTNMVKLELRYEPS